MAGAEFNPAVLPGKLNTNYTYPTTAEFEQLAAIGVNTVRLPIRWERIRNDMYGPMITSEMNQIHAVYRTAKRLNMCVIIDMHNYARYYDTQFIDSAGVRAAFIDTWLIIANTLPGPNHIALGLMNEPYTMPVQDWADLAQATVNKLRERGSQHLILVAGGRWSGAHDWFSAYSGVSNAVAFENFHDPLNRYALEVHQYMDGNYSGTGATCKCAGEFIPVFKRINAWAIEHGHPLFLGEFGVADNPTCLRALELFLMMTEAAPWRGWAYWAGGRWWGNYIYALPTASTANSNRWAVLLPYLYTE